MSSCCALLFPFAHHPSRRVATPNLTSQAYGTDDKAAQESGAAPLLGVVVGKADAGDDPSQPSSSASSSDAITVRKVLTGYIAMLAVETSWRRAGIGGCA